MSIPLSLLFGGLVGLALGSLGGGGSILVVPALIYGLAVPPKEAVVQSLVIVGLTSICAAVLRWRTGHVRVSAALMFALTGCVGVFHGATASRAVPDSVLVMCLGSVIAGAGVLMFRSARREKASVDRHASSTTTHPLSVLVAGYVVGVLTGFLGVGGGFLIVPALTLVARIPVKQAIGTSLVVISLNCSSGLVAHGIRQLDWQIVFPFLSASLTVSVLATIFARRASSALTKQLFACFIAVVGGLTLIGNFVASATAGPPPPNL